MSEVTKPTILYVHSSDEMYGADLILLHLVSGMQESGFRPVVVVPTDVAYDGLLTAALRERGIAVEHLKTAILRRKYFNFWGLINYFYHFVLSTMALIRLIRREDAAVVHTNTLSVIPGAVAAWLTRRPHVWHVHEIILKPRMLWRLTSWLVAKLAQVAVCVSGPTRDHLISGHPQLQHKTMVIHNGLDTAAFVDHTAVAQQIRAEWGVSNEEVVVGMIGRISHWKGQDYFLQVAQQVAAQHSGVRFVLVGGTFPGNEHLADELRQMIVTLGLSDQTIMNGFRADIPAVLQALDVFVLPSTLPDPLPTVVLEAMAAGKPVVANAHGGSIEMVQEGTTGFLTSPHRPSQMAEAIARLVVDPALRQQMGAAGRCRLTEYFSKEVFWQRWEEVYQSLILQTPVKSEL